MTGISVLAAPAIDPGSCRINLTLPEGLSLADIVQAALPGLQAADRPLARVTLVTPAGSAVIPAHLWHRVRPKPGVQVIIRLIPGKDALRSILSIVVSIAAVALGTVFGPAVGALLGTSAAVGGALVTLGVNMLGSLLVNALIPPVKPDDERRQSYSISGWRNRMDPDGAVPVVLGQIRYAPPFAVRSHTEIVGDWQYLRAVFCFGEGPVALTDFRIGETSIADFDEVEIELREGIAGDLPLSLYPRQIVEESIGVELTRPLPRDDLGEVIEGEPSEETPVVRTCGPDAEGASVIVAFPAGLFKMSSKGKRQQQTVTVRIEHRLAGAEEWQLVTTLDIAASKTEAFYRQHSWQFPSRGRWQVRLTKMSDDSDDSKIQQRTVWAGLQTLRPEYPIAYPRPLALVAVRVKATHQLSGALDNFSAMATRVCLDWDHVSGTWISRATSNPASLFRFVLQCPSNPKPVPDSGIDLDLLAGWHNFCRTRGLHYNRVQDQAGSTLRDVLTEVAAAGRASPRHDGLKWGVVIDRPAELIVDHVNPRNSWNFSVRRTYVDRPHAWIVKFQDEGNDYKEAQRVIRRPGYVGDISLTETLELPGLTDPEVVYREGLRRFLEAEHRPDVYEITQEGAVRVATRGDTIMLSHDVLSDTQWAGRVKSVAGPLVHLDELVTMDAGQDYGLRFRVFADDADTIGTSVLRQVLTAEGETQLLTLTGDGPKPMAGEIVHFGKMSTDSIPLVVTHIETTEDQCQIIRAVDAAVQIDTLTDAAEIPAWSSRVGVEIDENLLQPAAPRFVGIQSGLTATGSADGVEFQIEPGPGAVQPATYKVQHRLSGASAWITLTLPVASGGGSLTGYAAGAVIEMRVGGQSYAGIDGPYSSVVTVTIGAGDADIPEAISTDDVTVTTTLGGASVRVSVGDARAAQIQVYRSVAPTLNRATDAVGAPAAVAAPQLVTITVGETDKSNALTNAAFNTASDWLPGNGWSVANGEASHSAGSAGSLIQSQTLVVGKWYRLRYSVSSRTAGSVTPVLTGGTTRAGTPRAANGTFLDRIQAVSGNSGFGFDASADLEASIDNVTLYQETSACLAQGTHYLWIEPQNVDGVPGPVTGPFTITVI